MVHRASLIFAALCQVGQAVQPPDSESVDPYLTEVSDASALAFIEQTNTHLYKHRMTKSFLAFMQQHNRQYQQGTREYELRRELFEQRSKEVERQNSQPNRRWSATVNHLSDWTEKEKTSLYGYAGHASRHSGRASSSKSSFLQEKQGDRAVILSESKTWGSDVLDKIENQGACGSCWAVATAKMLEANYYIGTNITGKTFSPQELVDCVPNQAECGGTGGCKGATVELAALYFSQRGLQSRTEVPYTASDGQCSGTGKLQMEKFGNVDWLAEPDVMRPRMNHVANNEHFHGFQRLRVNQVTPLLEALQSGTVAVSVDGSPWSMYHSGIFDKCQGGSAVAGENREGPIINHAVLAIGYGKADNGDKYWLIQNSWGAGWGMGGRIKLLRTDGDADHCGWDNKPKDGTACKGGAKRVWACGMCGILYDNVIAKFTV